jgi:drug/metabolite transporter (DMT)-like permease
MATTTDVRPRTVLPTVAIGVTVLLWASAFVAIRHVGREISAGPLALGRLLAAAVVLGLVVLLRSASTGAWSFGRRGERGPPAGAAWRPLAAGALSAGWRGEPGLPRSSWPRLALVGVAWLGLYNVALNAAERRIDAGTAAMLVNVGPLLIAVLAGLVLGEGFPRRLVAGLTVAFAGAVLIGVATSTGGRADLWGVALCLAAAVSFAVGVVAQKPLLAGGSALHVTLAATLVGAVACLPYAGNLVHDLRAADPVTVGWLA